MQKFNTQISLFFNIIIFSSLILSTIDYAITKTIIGKNGIFEINFYFGLEFTIIKIIILSSLLLIKFNRINIRYLISCFLVFLNVCWFMAIINNIKFLSVMLYV